MISIDNDLLSLGRGVVGDYVVVPSVSIGRGRGVIQPIIVKIESGGRMAESYEQSLATVIWVRRAREGRVGHAKNKLVATHVLALHPIAEAKATVR